MKKGEYLKMLLQDVEGEKQPEKELYEAVLECTAEALSQSHEDFEVDAKIGIDELWKTILDKGRESKVKCVSPFRAAELIAEKLGAHYARPIHQLRAVFGDVAPSLHRLEDLI